MNIAGINFCLAVVLFAACSNPGADGTEGTDGIVGESGPPGPQGPVGPIGPQGIAGAQGPQGLQGIAGTPGVQGPIGPQGSAGAQGIQGAKGDTGTAGSTGLTGAQGPQGIQGSQGPVGSVGPQGPAGAGISVRVADTQGNQLGYPVTLRFRLTDKTSPLIDAVHMHRDNPEPTFPEGFLLFTHIPVALFFTEQGCTGTTVAMRITDRPTWRNVLYNRDNLSNVLYEVTGTATLVTKSNKSSGSDTCYNTQDVSQTVLLLTDSGYRFNLSSQVTLQPWEVIL